MAVSGALKGLAVALMKIANDLRWMNSGPLAGLAEIELHALQPGSAIMPGTVTLHTPFCGMRPLAAFDRTRSAVTPEAAHPLAFSPYTVPDFAS